MRTRFLYWPQNSLSSDRYSNCSFLCVLPFAATITGVSGNRNTNLLTNGLKEVSKRFRKVVMPIDNFGFVACPPLGTGKTKRNVQRKESYNHPSRFITLKKTLRLNLICIKISLSVLPALRRRTYPIPHPCLQVNRHPHGHSHRWLLRAILSLLNNILNCASVSPVPCSRGRAE